jgi:hypothetical protein
MQFRLTFSEIENLIQQKTGKELPLIYGGPHTVRISYKVPLMGSVGLDINVDRIDGSDIYLSYGGGKAIELMLRTAFNTQLKDRPGSEILQLLDGNAFLLSLGKNPQTAQIFERVTLQDIHFDEQSVIIEFTPKM